MDEQQADAFGRAGIATRQELLADEGGSAQLPEMAEHLGINQADLVAMAARGELIVVEDGTGELRCPRWQFDESRRVLAGLAEAIQTLKRSPGFTTVTPLRFFLQPHPRISGRPLDALRCGDIRAVLSAAAQELD